MLWRVEVVDNARNDLVLLELSDYVQADNKEALFNVIEKALSKMPKDGTCVLEIDPVEE